MKIYKIASDEMERNNLFDFLTRASEHNPKYKEAFLKRAEQVANGVVTDEHFAMWLGRMRDHKDFGKLASELADAYWKLHK